MQLKRIRTGRQRGAIDAAELARLQALQQWIRAQAQQLRSSGDTLTVRERLRLQRALNSASRAIRRAGRR